MLGYAVVQLSCAAAGTGGEIGGGAVVTIQHDYIDVSILALLSGPLLSGGCEVRVHEA